MHYKLDPKHMYSVDTCQCRVITKCILVHFKESIVHNKSVMNVILLDHITVQMWPSSAPLHGPWLEWARLPKVEAPTLQLTRHFEHLRRLSCPHISWNFFILKNIHKEVKGNDIVWFTCDSWKLRFLCNLKCLHKQDIDLLVHPPIRKHMLLNIGMFEFGCSISNDTRD